LKLTARLHSAAHPLAILRQRNFGLVWSAIMLTGMGQQMETLVLAWFVLKLTDSPFLLGLAASARISFNFLALFAGAVADRVPRQLLMASAAFLMASLALVMLVLIATDSLETWHIFAITLVGGLGRIFLMPAAHSLTADSVPENRISNAVALTNMGMNITLIIGPIVGGRLFEARGPEAAYALIVILYFSGGIAALMVRTTRSAISRQAESVFSTVLQGLKYVKGQQVIWAALLAAVIINLTGFPFHISLMPIFARDVLGKGPTELGMLMSAFGIGALVGSLVLASVQDLKHAGKLLGVAVVVWHASMVAFAQSTFFPLSLAILLVTGMAFASTLVLILTVILRTAPPEFRGRIMGLRVLAIYAHFFGSLLSGATAEAWGAPQAARINAVVGITLIGTLAFFAPKLQRA
jgi:MFS family permease